MEMNKNYDEEIEKLKLEIDNNENEIVKFKKELERVNKKIAVRRNNIELLKGKIAILELEKREIVINFKPASAGEVNKNEDV